MKFSETECKTMTPEVIATGVQGGGYIVLKATGMYGSPQIGTSVSDFAGIKTETTKFTVDDFPFIQGNKIWLNEGEQLFGCANYRAYNNSLNQSTYSVLYLNSEPAPQTNTQTPPINLTGTIQLNQQ